MNKLAYDHFALIYYSPMDFFLQIWGVGMKKALNIKKSTNENQTLPGTENMVKSSRCLAIAFFNKKALTTAVQK